jgi:hypothetical protein
MRYFIGQWAQARKDFERHFKVSIGTFYDGETTVVFQKICIDIFKFDEWLHARHGDYEDRGLSMEEIVIEKYGNEANELINDLI